MSKENPNELKIINKNERLKYQKLLYKYKQQIAELKTENERLSKMNDRLSQGIYWGNGEQFSKRINDLKQQLKEKDEQLKQSNEIINNPNTLIFQQEELIESLNKQIKSNTKQVCEKIRDYITSNEKDEYDYYNDEFSGRYTVNVKDLNKFLNQIENGE